LAAVTSEPVADPNWAVLKAVRVSELPLTTRSSTGLLEVPCWKAVLGILERMTLVVGGLVTVWIPPLVRAAAGKTPPYWKLAPAEARPIWQLCPTVAADGTSAVT